ncbi:MAG TPA: RNA polymerase sigma factor [Phycisphaerales bacterium]|nr:RNA polymerase sigma factor [Phycisphaerales bacterium]
MTSASAWESERVIIGRMFMTQGAPELVGDDDDASLGRRAEREPAAFEAIYRRHYRTVAAYLYRRCGDVDVAEELAADVFVAAFGSIARMNRKGVAPRYWLLGIAAHTASKSAREKRRRARRERVHTEARDGQVDPARGSPLWTDEQRRVHDAVDGLPEVFGVVVSLYYFAGLSVEEITASIGTAAGTVKSRLARGREMVREKLENRGGES